MENGDTWITVERNNKVKNNKPINKSYIVKPYQNRQNKKILCTSFLNKNECKYGNRCVFAHSYDEQIIDKNRKSAYDIILKKSNITTISSDIYAELMILTKVCKLCINNTCPGGYNCKYGTFSAEYQVCASDLNNGGCNNLMCAKFHLTKVGIKPINGKIFSAVPYKSKSTRCVTTQDIEFLTKMQTHDIFAEHFSETSSSCDSGSDCSVFSLESQKYRLCDKSKKVKSIDGCNKSIFE